MIKCKLNKKGVARCKGSLRPMELLVGIAQLTRMFYLTTEKESQIVAEKFRRHLLTMLLDRDSPVWTGKVDADASDIIQHLNTYLQDDPDGCIGESITGMTSELLRLRKQNAALTAALREHVDDDHLCFLCRHYDQCHAEAKNDDDHTTRFWRCKTGEEFEFKEVE